eukprot:3940121-Rhodomonas_salina.1
MHKSIRKASCGATSSVSAYAHERAWCTAAAHQGESFRSIFLRACYALSGTDLASGTPNSSGTGLADGTPSSSTMRSPRICYYQLQVATRSPPRAYSTTLHMVLRTCYEISGTDFGYAPTY